MPHSFSLPDVYHSPSFPVVHCGVVGNIQAFHVCAPGSIPGDGVFLLVSCLSVSLMCFLFLFVWIPTIAQLVERRTVVGNRFP